MSIKKTYCVLLVSTMIAGCGNLTSIHRVLNTNDGSGVLIDIKQRAIVAMKNQNSPFGAVVCAEPSPDALSAYAAEISAKANTPDGVSAQLATALQESTSFNGLRTQSIQLLRDSLYRSCEAFMNGALSPQEYDLLARRYQKHTVALLAIEQLTGAIKAPVVTINTSGSAEFSKSLAELRATQEKISAEIAVLETLKANKNATTTDVQKAKIDAQLAELKADKDAVSKGMEATRGALVSGQAQASVSLIGLPMDRKDETVQAVASTVEKIVLNIINTDDFGQLCFMYLRADTNTLNLQERSLQDVCTESFKNADERVRISNMAKLGELNAIKDAKMSPEKRVDAYKGYQERHKGEHAGGPVLLSKPPRIRNESE